jgi:hypothetical protein
VGTVCNFRDVEPTLWTSISISSVGESRLEARGIESEKRMSYTSKTLWCCGSAKVCAAGIDKFALPETRAVEYVLKYRTPNRRVQ